MKEFFRMPRFCCIMMSVVLFWGIISCSKSTKSGGKIGKPAADFVLTSVDGQTVSLKNYRDKVVLLNFWATWCPPCRAEIPDFIRMYEKYKKNGLEILGVTLSSGSFDDIRKFAEENSMNYPVLTGDEKYLNELTERYGGIKGVPTTFLIDKQGIIRKVWVGSQSESAFLEEILRIGQR